MNKIEEKKPVSIIFRDYMQTFSDEYIILDSWGTISDDNYTLICVCTKDNEKYFFKYKDIAVIYVSSDEQSESLDYTELQDENLTAISNVDYNVTYSFNKDNDSEK